MATLGQQVLSGLVCAVIVIAFGLVDAALLFSGPLSQYLAVGIALTTLGAVILVCSIGLFGRLRGAQGGSQEAPVVIIFTMLTALQSQVDSHALLVTSLAVISLSSLACGLTLWLVGFSGAGRYVRLIPHPVLAGFLAGSGVLMAGFALTLMNGEPVVWSELFANRDLALISKLGVGLLLCAVLLYLDLKGAHPLILPFVLLAGVLGFHALVAFSPLELNAFVADGWTLATAPVQTNYPPLDLVTFSAIDWSAILVVSPQLLSLMVVVTLANLIKVSSIELMFEQQVDENKELRLSGVANLICAPLALVPGYHSMSGSQLAYRLGNASPMVALFCGIFSVIAIFFAGGLLMYLPRFVFGGILLWLGLSIFYDSLVTTWGRIRRIESAMIALIAFTVVVIGFLPGLVVGLACGIVMFVIEYSQQTPVRGLYSGAQMRSNVDRDPATLEWLAGRGEQVLIVRLHGYLFFGTAHRFVQIFNNRLKKLEPGTLRHLILDFDHVTGIDLTALRAFERVAFIARDSGFTVQLCGTRPDVAKAMARDAGVSLQTHALNLDEALEFVEEQMLYQRELGATPEAIDLGLCSETPVGSLFRDKGELLELAMGEPLLAPGEWPVGVMLLMSGELDAWVSRDETRIRVRRMRPGAMVGEVSYFLEQPASAGVVAVSDASLLLLSHKALADLVVDNPTALADLHRHLAQLLARRLQDNGRLIGQLL